MTFGMDLRDLTQTEQNLITLAFGVDAIIGEDPLSPSGMNHMMVDTWTSGANAPAIYHDPLAVEMREKGGFEKIEDPTAVKKFIKKYNLHELNEQIQQTLTELPPKQRTFVSNLSVALSVALQTFDPNTKNPSFDERYIAATREPRVEVADHIPYQMRLTEALTKAGYSPKENETLRDLFLRWEHDQGFVGANPDGTIDGAVIETKFYETIKKVLEIAKKRTFPIVDIEKLDFFGEINSVPFDGFKFKALSNVPFTGSSIYQGGGEKTPLLKGLLEYNVDHPMTKAGLLHLVAHEAMIGHYFHSAISDLLWRSGRLPFQATMGTMCTPSVAFQEGWAENAIPILYGSLDEALKNVQNDFGVDANALAIILAHAHLQSVAKHNVAIMFQKEGKTLEEIADHVAQDCVQPDPIVKKMSGAWAQHPVLGAMYGPAYLLGTEMIAKALREKGQKRVLEIGLQLTGQMADLETFKEQIYRS